MDSTRCTPKQDPKELPFFFDPEPAAPPGSRLPSKASRRLENLDGRRQSPAPQPPSMSSEEVRLVTVEKPDEECLGFHLTRGRWDPYPWVSRVDPGSPAAASGVRDGDCLLEVDGADVVGLRVSEVAERVRAPPSQVALLVWNAGVEEDCSPESLCCGPLPSNLQKLSACMTSILAFLECPVCLDIIPPPTYQCNNGHLICIRCRSKSERCPVCRMRLNTGRSLLSDQVYNALIDSFNLREESAEVRQSRMHKIFKHKSTKKNVPDIKVTQSHTNKFLARLSGKASSDDNLNSKSFLSPNSSGQQDFGINLKVKSLSTNEIFHCDSPAAVSRSNSANRINRKERNFLTINSEGNGQRPASYHGSYESLDRGIDKSDDRQFRNNFNNLKIVSAAKQDESILFYCPFDYNCASLVTASNIIGHFQDNHNHRPLVQYFTANIQVPFKKLMDDEENCFVINLETEIYFLKSLANFKNSESSLKDILIWIWHTEDGEMSKKLEMQAEVRKKSCEVPFLSFRNPIFPLSNMPASEIKDCKRGMFFSAMILESLGNFEELILDIRIFKNNVS